MAFEYNEKIKNFNNQSNVVTINTMKQTGESPELSLYGENSLFKMTPDIRQQIPVSLTYDVNILLNVYCNRRLKTYLHLKEDNCCV